MALDAAGWRRDRGGVPTRSAFGSGDGARLFVAFHKVSARTQATKLGMPAAAPIHGAGTLYRERFNRTLGLRYNVALTLLTSHVVLQSDAIQPMLTLPTFALYNDDFSRTDALASRFR